MIIILVLKRWYDQYGKRLEGAIALFLAASALAGCLNDEEGKRGSTEASSPAPSVSIEAAGSQAEEQPGTSYYEIFVRSFYDSNTDTDLGVEGIWLMPIQVSPSYHGYDVTDYYSINPEYGTMEDFKIFLAEAHKRGIKVIMDLVVNHTSSEHPWFKEAAASIEAPHRQWYTWAGEGTRIDEGSAAGGKAWQQRQAPTWAPSGKGCRT